MRERNKQIEPFINQDEKFKIWLVGFTDGEGSFVITKSGGYYKLQYNLSQSAYNLRLLYYIKSKLGYGNVSKSLKQNLGNFRITDRKILNKIIFSIFDKYPLLTSKYYNYERFKKAYYILEDKNITTSTKNEMIKQLISVDMPSDYMSPALKHLSIHSEYKQLAQAISIY